MDPRQWEKASEIFNAASELEPADREEFVCAACAGDAATLSLVARMFAQEASMDGFLESPPPLGPPPTAPPASAALPVGRVLAGRHRLTSALGVGGMGEVYSAIDLQNGDSVALKLLRGDLAADPLLLARFRREFQLARRIKHRNVCSVYDLMEDRSDSGAPIVYLVMEFLEGRTLNQTLKDRGRLPYAEALAIAVELAKGLDAAHAAGVIHRDFKPANVMIRSTGNPRAVIMDFGIARSAQPRSEHSRPTLTATGLQPGTHGYMAPEQLANGAITTAVDIYAYGVVLRDIAEKGGFLRSWSRVIQGCTALEVSLRFATATEAAGRLPARILSRRVAVAGGAAAACAAVSGVFLLARGDGWAPTAPGAKVMVADTQNSTDEKALDAIAGLLRLQLGQSARVNVASVEEVEQVRRQAGLSSGGAPKPADWQQIAWRANADILVSSSVNRLGVGYNLAVEIERRGSAPDSRLGVRTQTISSRDRAALMAAVGEISSWIRRQAGEAASDVARFDRLPSDVSTPSWEALAFYARAEEAFARRAYADALTLLDEALVKDPEFTLAATRRGDVLMGLQRHREGLSQWRAAIRLLPKRSLTRREEVYVRGMYAFDTGDVAGAQKHFSAWALEFPNDWRGYFYQTVPLILSGFAAQAVRNLGRVHQLNPEYSRADAQLANCHIALGEWEAAAKSVAALRAAGDGPGAAFKEGSLLFAKADAEGARRWFRALRQAEDPTWRARGALYEGMLDMELRDYGGAARSATPETVRLLPPDQKTYAAYLWLLRAFALWRAGDSAGTRRSVAKALEFEAGPHALGHAGSLLARAGDLAGAARQLAQAQELADMPAYAIAAHSIAGEIAEARGDRSAALASYRRAAEMLPAAAFRNRLAKLLPADEGREILRRTVDLRYLVFLDPMKQEPGWFGDAVDEPRKA